MTVLLLELRVVWNVTEAERAQLPAPARPGPLPAVAWDAVRTIAELMRAHVPPGVSEAYLLAQAYQTEGPGALGGV